jgi:hypothetical protein
MNKLYVQFINRGVLCRERNTPFYIFQNGLSNANCDGEMIWLEPKQSIPDFHGIVYISAWYGQDLTETYKFAKNNPKSIVILGGPIVHAIKDVPKYKLPNIIMTEKSAESVIGEGAWNLEIPQRYNDSHVSWTQMVDSSRGCYWGQCTFCRASQGKPLTTFREIESIPIVEVGKTKSIWLGSLCLSPKALFNIFSTVSDREDVFYFSYVRATKSSADALRCSKNAGKQCVFVCGLEFPGNRMLSQIRKGMRTEDQLYFIKTLTKMGCEISLNFIIDWIGINERDIRQAREFFNELKLIHNGNLSAKVYELHLVPSVFTDNYSGEKVAVSNSLGDIINYLPVLSDKEKRLNAELREIYYDFPWLFIDESSLNSQRPTAEVI